MDSTASDSIKLKLPSPFFRLFERTNFTPKIFTSKEELFQTKFDSHIRSLAVGSTIYLFRSCYHVNIMTFFSILIALCA